MAWGGVGIDSLGGAVDGAGGGESVWPGGAWWMEQGGVGIDSPGGAVDGESVGIDGLGGAVDGARGGASVGIDGPGGCSGWSEGWGARIILTKE